MPAYGRQDLARLWSCLKKGETAPVYFIFGDRYLCQEIADELVSRLLPESAQRAGSLKNIDGDQEEIGQTINMFRTYALFGGRQVLRVNDSRILSSKELAATLWQKAAKAHASQEPGRARRYLLQMLALTGLLPSDWENEEIASWPPGRWQEVFSFARPEERAWVQPLLLDQKEGPSVAETKKDAAEQLLAALETGVPRANILILVAEAADKRKKLFKYLEKHGVVIDLAVDTGSGSAARRDQETVLTEIVSKTLAGFGKKLEPRALAPFLERVGFQPLAAAMEAEKLALYAEAETIRLGDVDAMVGRTREEALYALNEAFAGRDLGRSLVVMHRLRENGVYSLVIVAGLRNLLRKLLLVRTIIEQPSANYSRGISFPAFQKTFLPALKETLLPWPAQLNGHPFAVHKSFLQAERFAPAELKNTLSELLTAEYRLKGSGLPDQLVLEHFFFAALRPHDH